MLKQMLKRIIHYFFPDLSPHEIRKFSLIGGIAFVLLATYWLLKLLKQTIFFKVAFPEAFGWVDQQGALFQPIAKFWSPIVVLVAVLLYSKLIDLVKKHQLFYIICTFYGFIFLGITSVLLIREWYGIEALGKQVLAATGWIVYFSVESFGSLIFALFWSFTNSITDSDTAKRGFPLVMAFAQTGALLGSIFLLCGSSWGTLWPMVGIAALGTFGIMIMVRHFMKTIPAQELVGNERAAATENRKEGFFEGFFSGITLLLSRPYLLGIFAITTIDSITTEILEYQMHRLAATCPSYGSEATFCWFQSLFGVCTNVVSLLLVIFGITYALRSFGLRRSLLIYPIMFALVLVFLLSFSFLWSQTTLAIAWAIFAALMVLRGLSLAFQQPLKEILYIPTSKDAKFKSKGWIDMFGGRFAKSASGSLNNLYKYDLSSLMLYGSLLSFGFIGIWIVAALYVGTKHHKLTQENKIVE